MNLIINCSSDRLQIWIGSAYQELSNRGLECTFGPQLIEWFREHHITTIYVINGPGSFTTLRVVCLVINLYASMNPHTITIYECNKIQLYQYLGVSQIYLYIGQRNNVRQYDYITQISTIIPKSDLDTDILLDDVTSDYSNHPQAKLTVEHNNIIISDRDKTYSIPPSNLMSITSQIQPHYLILPNTGNS